MTELEVAGQPESALPDHLPTSRSLAQRSCQTGSRVTIHPSMGSA